jgi:hypothetical protein
MARYLGILLSLVLAGAAMPTAFSYQEDQRRDVFQNHKFFFGGFSNKTEFPFEKFTNRTQFFFGGYSNKTWFPIGRSQNQTDQGQEISSLMHEINYLKQEIANTIKEQQKDNKTKFQEQFKALKLHLGH